MDFPFLEGGCVDMLTCAYAVLDEFFFCAWPDLLLGAQDQGRELSPVVEVAQGRPVGSLCLLDPARHPPEPMRVHENWGAARLQRGHCISDKIYVNPAARPQAFLQRGYLPR